jgi:multiple antibiotic resistance protein
LLQRPIRDTRSPADPPPRIGLAAACLFALGLCLAALPVVAQAAGEAVAAQPVIGPKKIFVLLFLMLGPIKILVPFVNMTDGADAAFRHHLAGRAVLFSAAALALAGLVGRGMLANFNIPVAVLALTGGLVLFLVALQTVLQQSSGRVPPSTERPPPELKLAFSPLAFPIIVTPYGIAAIIVFVALAQDDGALKLAIVEVVALILLLDWLAMLFAHVILKWLGVVLQVFAVVLGVTQIALGLHVIIQSLGMIGLFVPRLS